MNLLPQHLFTKANQTTTGQRILQFPVTRIILYSILAILGNLLAALFGVHYHFLENQEPLNSIVVIVAQLSSYVLMILLMIIFIHLIEKRKALEYDVKGGLQRNASRNWSRCFFNFFSCLG